MSLEDIMLSEMSQAQKDKCHMTSLMWQLRSGESKEYSKSWGGDGEKMGNSYRGAVGIGGTASQEGNCS
jgi:hypothetical protein